ncbi:MAG TPA: sodium/solute symporter [Thermoanaerobaculia bacterium]|nr:sodium/solute symporter [Thermoanaerobaculia bacterium]
MTAADYTIVVAYFLVIGGIGLWFSRGPGTTSRYFVADRQLPRWIVAFTLMATLISTNTVVAHPGIVFSKGMVLVPGFLMIPVVLLGVAVFIVPFYRRVVRMSAYEYIGRRFGTAGRLYASFGFVVERTFDVGLTLVTTSIAVQLMTGWSMGNVIIAVALFTMAYTMVGGIRAVVWTDMVQGILLMAGGVVVLGRLLFAPEAGAPFAVLSEAAAAGKFSFGSTALSWETLYAEERTLWILTIAIIVQWTRRFVCDQHMVQRYLLGRTDAEARAGALFGALLLVPVLLLFNLIGACLYGFYQLSGAKAPAIVDHILPHFIIHYLPPGLTGLMLAAVLAASMSSLSSDLNSLGAVLSSDYFQRLFPRLSEKAQLAIGRTMVFVTGVAAAGVAFVLIPGEESRPLAERALTIAVIVSAGSLGLFTLGSLTRRATARGAMAGIAAAVLFTAWGVLTEPAARWMDLGRLNFAMNAILIGVLAHVVLFTVGYAVSLLFGGYRPADVDRLLLRSRVEVSVVGR